MFTTSFNPNGNFTHQWLAQSIENFPFDLFIDDSRKNSFPGGNLLLLTFRLNYGGEKLTSFRIHHMCLFYQRLHLANQLLTSSNYRPWTTKRKSFWHENPELLRKNNLKWEILSLALKIYYRFCRTTKESSVERNRTRALINDTQKVPKSPNKHYTNYKFSPHTSKHKF